MKRADVCLNCPMDRSCIYQDADDVQVCEDFLNVHGWDYDDEDDIYEVDEC